MAREALGDIGEVQRRSLEHGGDLVGELADDLRRCLLSLAIGLAAEIIGDLGRIGVSVGNALVALLGNAFRDRRIDADLGGGWYDAVWRRRERRVQRLAAGIAD